MTDGPNLEDSLFSATGSLKVEELRALPDVIDVLVAGGGPGGTAAAVRAKELGLSALVIDYDDLLKRIRDYPKEKLIKPNFGGGDKLQWPRGGPMLEGLAFEDIDKDEFVAIWKQKYRDLGIPAKIGVEFTGVQRQDDGTWLSTTWNHRAGRAETFRSRAVVIAIGAGVPRRFAIPGDTDGIAFRLSDPADYVGAPVLVLGGGDSATEAVIAISHAKVDAEDPTDVFWSYRGTKMPRVSKALGDAFFDAYVGNGNVRYLPLSNPAAVFTGPDREEYLSLEVDRKVMEGRPHEVVHLQFPKNRVIACIGEEPPRALIHSLDIKVPEVDGKPYMLVDAHGECSQPGLFLVGDALGSKFLRCTDHSDASTYEKITQRRNIKISMVEAVRAVEALASRLGKLEGAAAAATPDPMPAEVKAAAKSAIIPPVPPEPDDARPSATTPQLVALLPDGSEESRHPLGEGAFEIGRKAADLAFPEDQYMADVHARLVRRGDAYEVEDTGAGSGLWLRIPPGRSQPLAAGDAVWLGAQILLVGQGEGGWTVQHFGPDGVAHETYPVGGEGFYLGRTSTVKLDSRDGSLSRRHAYLQVEGGVPTIEDVGAKNGLYRKLVHPTPLAPGDEIRLAMSRLRFEVDEVVSKLPESAVVQDSSVFQLNVGTLVGAAAPAEAGPPATAEAPAAVPGEGVDVVLEGDGERFAFKVPAGATVLEAYCAHRAATEGVDPDDFNADPVEWSCWDPDDKGGGSCGACIVEIVEGGEHFEDAGKKEAKTLGRDTRCEGKGRLICINKVSGPVSLRVP